jgi:ribosomal-protein-alanine N-acetyltransferase
VIEMIPILETERLLLRPYELSDAERVEQLAGHKKVAETTLHIPHPYPKGLASSWIASHQERASKGESFIFAVVVKPINDLIGTMAIRVDKEHNRGELAYWFGVPYWGKGYCTESAKKVVDFGFNTLGLNKIWASAMTRNPASINVMRKIGLKHEGTFRQHVLKSEQYEDLEYYSILKSEYIQS